MLLRTHILVTLANRHSGHVSELVEGPQGRPQTLGGGPPTGKVANALATLFYQMGEVKCFLIAKLVLKCQSTWKMSGLSPVGEHSGGAARTRLPSLRLQVEFLGAHLMEALPGFPGPAYHGLANSSS